MASTPTDKFEARVAPILERLRQHFNQQSPIVSDVVDSEGHQYVNLVQEGGGVLGIALVGYTYILEQMGIRFMKMAGTSAGAINTMLLTCLGGKQEAKSLRILELMDRQPFFDFVDGDPAAKRIIRHLITSESYVKRLFIWVAAIITTLIVSSLCAVFVLGSGHRGWFFWLTMGLLIASASAFAWLLNWVVSKRKKFYQAEFGVNPGHVFEQWISGVLKNNGIENLNHLRAHVQQTPPGGFMLRRQEDAEPLGDLNSPQLESFLVLVTSDITNQMKVEFPRMWNLYWDDPQKVNPAVFVRASMAVPIFFKPFMVKEIPRQAVLPSWQTFAEVDDLNRVPTGARFVDGGMISNFPINVFYNPHVRAPRLPTFGIMLGDEFSYPAQDYKSLLGFVGAMFNTIRFNYDKEFLIKNADFNKTIGRIDVSGVNWLNFNISDPEKLLLFERGAQAAADFLMGKSDASPATQAPASDRAMKSTDAPSDTVSGFDWEQYKAYRKARREKLGF